MTIALLLMLITIIILFAFVLVITVMYRNNISHMTGMMVAMAIGMSAGIAIGVIVGILLSGNLFQSTVIAVLAGCLDAWWAFLSVYGLC